MHNDEAAVPSVSTISITSQTENQDTHEPTQYTFGTWNVQGLNKKNQKRKCYEEIENLKADVIVLTETKLERKNQEWNEHYTHIYSGYVLGRARAGVGIVIKNNLAGNLKWKAVNERIITAEINILRKIFTIIGVYWVNESDKKDVKIGFEKDFKAVLRDVNKDHELIILGDFNSRVGIFNSQEFKKFQKQEQERQENRNLDFREVVGNCGDEVLNENGKTLIRICYDFGLKIQNTFFENEDIRKYTCYQKRKSSKSIIDLCITRQENALKVQNVFACETVRYKTDHMFLKAIISISNKFHEEVRNKSGGGDELDGGDKSKKEYESRKDDASKVEEMLKKLNT